MAAAEVARSAGDVAFLRTPNDRFIELPDWSYPTSYVHVDGLRMAYVEQGSPNGTTVLLLHGEPTWGYLYRRMLPVLTGAGCRVVVPDLIGFGRSDKPIDRTAYTYTGHVTWMTEFISLLGLRDIVLFCQDWGGLIGLRVAAENPDWFSRLVITNTALPDGSPMSDGFMLWQAASQQMSFMDCGQLLQRATQARELTPSEVDAYRAPFPDESYMAGARQFPLLVPTSPDDPAVPANRAAWRALEAWEKPVLTLWAPGDPVLGDYQQGFIDRIPGAAGQLHQTFSPAGHFIQDDAGEQVARAMVDWLGEPSFR